MADKRVSEPAIRVGLVGAGPLGIEMAVALKKAGIAYVHFEAGQIGSTMQWWAPGTRWFSSNERIAIAGVPLVTAEQEKATREEYLAYLRGVVEQFGLEIKTYTKVAGIEKASGERFSVRYRPAMFDVADGDEWVETVEVDKVILATGGTAAPNFLEIPGEDLPHVSHYFHDPHAYFRKRLLIVGGRNSAVEAAMRCHREGAEVHFSYRGEGVDAKDIKYWLYPEFASLLKAGRIVGHFRTCPELITEKEVVLRRTDVAREHSGEIERLAADFVLLLTGYRADMSLARAAGVELKGPNEAPAFNAETMETNVPGVYIAGTAVAGTQSRYKVFLENCHIHVGRIVAHLTGGKPPVGEKVVERPES